MSKNTMNLNLNVDLRKTVQALVDEVQLSFRTEEERISERMEELQYAKLQAQVEADAKEQAILNLRHLANEIEEAKIINDDLDKEVTDLRERLDFLEKQFSVSITRLGDLHAKYALTYKAVVNKDIQLSMSDYIWFVKPYPSGAGDFYQFSLKAGITFEYKITEFFQCGGQNNSPKSTGQLIITCPKRAKPLNITFKWTGDVSKQENKNAMCGTALYYMTEGGWIEDLTISGNIHPNPGPRFSREREKDENNKRMHSPYSWDPNSLKHPVPFRDSVITQRYAAFKKHSQVWNKLIAGKSKVTFLHAIEFMRELLLNRGYGNLHKKLIPSRQITFSMVHFVKTGILRPFTNSRGVKPDKVPLFEDYVGKHAVKEKGWEIRRFILYAIRTYNVDPALYYFAAAVGWQAKNILQKAKTNSTALTLADLSMFQKQMHKIESSCTTTNDGWIASKLKKAGSQLAEGAADKIMPIIEKIKDSIGSVVNKLPSFKDLAFGVTVVFLILAFIIMGWRLVMMAHAVIFGVERIDYVITKIDGELCSPVDTSGYQQQKDELEQKVGITVVSGLARSWYDSISSKCVSFSKAFSDSEIVKFTKKLGDFSNALKNVTLLCDKIKEIIRWILNKGCTLVTGHALFESDQHLALLLSKVNELMKVVRLANPATMNESAMKEFCASYSDLVEMHPYISKMDKVLAAQINTCILHARDHYNTCEFQINFNVERFQPESFYLFGMQGQGKTNVSKQMQKMLFDAIGVISPTIQSEIFFGGKGNGPFSRTMVYPRMMEQEFWDMYRNHPFCTMDDFGQPKGDPTLTMSEAFTFIRAVNSAPYPLHMASLLAKETTVFTSKAVFLTTNLTESQLSLSGLSIACPEAFKRRRTYAIEVFRDDVWIDQGPDSKEYLDTIKLKVYKVNSMDGSLSKEAEDFAGSEAIGEFMHRAAKRMIARWTQFKQTTSLDFTGLMAQIDVIKSTADSEEQLYEAKKAALEKIYADHLAVMNKQLEEHGVPPISEEEVKIVHNAQKAVIEQAKILVNRQKEDAKAENFSASAIRSMFTPAFEDLPASSASSSALTTTSSNIDLSEYKTQMFLFGAGALAAIKAAHYVQDTYYTLHPEAAYYLTLHSGIRITTYNEAKSYVAKYRRRVARNGGSFSGLNDLDDPAWTHDILVKGIREADSSPMTFFKYRLGMFLRIKNSNKDLAEAAQKLGMSKDDVKPYIGLTDKLYWEPKDKFNAFSEMCQKYIGIIPRTFDFFKESEDGFLSVSGSKDFSAYYEQFLYELKHESALREHKGKSSFQMYSDLVTLVSLFLAALFSVVMMCVYCYKSMDPRPHVITDSGEFQPQSGGPEVDAMQRELAKMARMPRINAAQFKKQFMDLNADQLIPIVQNNTWTLLAEKTTNGIKHVYSSLALGIEKDWFAVPGHMLAEHPDNLILFKAKATSGIYYDFETLRWQYVKQIGPYSGSDLALVEFAGLPFIEKLTHLLQKDEDNMNGTEGFTRVSFKYSDQGCDTLESQAKSPAEIVNSDNYSAEYSPDKNHKVRNIARIELDETSLCGMCCRSYIIKNTKVPRKLGWLHIAGKGHYALAGRVTQEDVAKFALFLQPKLSEFKKQVGYVEVMPDPHILDEHGKMLKFTRDPAVEHGMYRLGVLSRKFTRPLVSRTIASPLAKNWQYVEDGILKVKEPPLPILKAPALLKRRGKVDPMLKSLEGMENKQNIYSKFFRPHHYDGVFSETVLKHSTGRILTLLEALRGKINHPHGKSIKRDTSTAFYLQMFSKLKRDYCCFSIEEFNARQNKEDYTFLGESTWLHRWVVILVTAWFLNAKDGKIPLNWVLHCLKDEAIKKAKVESGDSRLFYMGNFAFMLVSKMIFGDFVTALETYWYTTDICIGCNPYSVDWKIIAEHLNAGTSDNPEVWDDDTFKWDKHYPTVEFTETFPEEYCQRMRLIGKVAVILLPSITLEIDYCKLIYIATVCNFALAIVVENKVFLYLSQGSGVDMTGPFNSMCNSASGRAGIEYISKRPFNEVARQKVYGDDVVIRPLIKIDRREFWAIIKKKLGMIRTGSDKSDNPAPVYLYGNCYFLQRQFVQDGVMMCPLNPTSIHTCIQWLNKPTDKTEEAQFAINCKVALNEIARHGEAKFNELKEIVNFYLERMGKSYVIHSTYGEMREDIVTRATLCKSFLTDLSIYQQQASSEKSTSGSTTVMTEGSDTTVSVEGLTTFKEATHDLQVDECVDYVGRPISNPFRAPVPSDLIGRAYEIASFTWTSATGLVKIPLIGALSQTTPALALFKLYRLARCCFKISIKMQSSIYFQGALIVGWLPNVLTTATGFPLDIQSISAYHGKVLSANTQDTLSITIPYCSPEDWFDTGNFTGTSFEHATVFIIPLFTLISSSATVPAAAPVTVFGSIETMDLSGYQSQMAKVINKGAPRDKEAESKARQAKDAGVGMVVRNTSHIVRRIPFIGTVWSPIADVINMIFDTELSKPINNSAPQDMVPVYANDVNQADGLDQVTRLSLYTGARTSIRKTMFGMETSMMSLAQFAQQPMLFDKYTFNSSTAISWSTVVRNINLGAAYTYYDYLAIASFMCRYTRGSTKYVLYFCMSGFYSARFRISLSYGTVNNYGDVPSMIIDVNGDKWFNLLIPFLEYRTWRDQFGMPLVTLPTLRVDQIGQIVGAPSGTTAVVYMAVFRAGGPDVQFAVPTDPANVDLSRFEKQTDLRSQFEGKFEALSSGQTLSQENHYCMAETIDSLHDLLKRPAEYPANSVYLGPTLATLSAHSIICQSFLYWRGTRVYRNIHMGLSGGYRAGFFLNVSSSAPRLEHGWSPAYSAATQPYQPETAALPYYCATPFVPTVYASQFIHGSSIRVLQVNLNISQATEVLALSAGDDFVMMFPVPWANQLTLFYEAPKPHAARIVANKKV